MKTGRPAPQPQSVPHPAAGTAAERVPVKSARIWFAQGFWWFRFSHDGSIREITSLMRQLRYDAADLARALGVGERSFHRLVRDEVGHPVGYWLRMLRAVEFRKRIGSGEPIKCLAYDFGFSHPGDFSVEFKRWYGVSPSAYLKSRLETCKNLSVNKPVFSMLQI